MEMMPKEIQNLYRNGSIIVYFTPSNAPSIFGTLFGNSASNSAPLADTFKSKNDSSKDNKQSHEE